MELTHRPGNLSCSEVSELLSDLLDARRGELPHPDGTRLAEAGVRPGMELHLAACETCRRELAMLEEIGDAYSDFAVNEVPAQMFQDYGQKIRNRMKRGAASANVTPLRSNHKRWWAVSLAATAAAAWAIVISTGALQPREKDSRRMAKEIALAGKRVPVKETTHAPHAPDRTPIVYERPTVNGFQPMTISNPMEPATLQEMQQHEGRSGYLVFPEPLLGLRLKTTRDEDRVADEGPGGLMVEKVVPGSPAYNMGLRKNDYIVTCNGEPITDGGAMEAVKFLSKLRELGAGADVDLHIVRPVYGEYLFMKPVSGVLGQYESAP